MNREEAINMLKSGEAGVKAWNEYRKSAEVDALPDFSDADFDNAELVQANLSRLKLNGAKFNGAKLAYAWFYKSELVGADFSIAAAHNAVFSEAKLSNSNFENATLTESNFTHAILTEANFTDADLTEADFTDADLTESKLSKSTVYLTIFVRSILTGSSIINTTVSKSNFRHANLSFSRLWNLIVTETCFTGCNFYRSNFGNCDATGANFWGAIIDPPRNPKWIWQQKRSILKANLEIILCYYWQKCRTFASWQTVRSVGSLQVLTKASYVMLALVPLLAGTWHGVKLYVDQSKSELVEVLNKVERSANHRHLQLKTVTNEEAQQLSNAIERLQTALEQLEKMRLGAAPKEAIEALTNVDNMITRMQGRMQTTSEIELQDICESSEKLKGMLGNNNFNPKLPLTWALGFFAALFVVLGHFVYQVFCPELLKDGTVDKFTSSLLNEFSSEASQHHRNDKLLRAINALKELAKRIPSLNHPCLVERHGRIVWIPDSVEHFDKRDDKDPNFDQGLMLIAIEEGAKAEYELKSLDKPFPAFIAFLLYLLAGFIIAVIVYTQAAAVARSTGWIA